MDPESKTMVVRSFFCVFFEDKISEKPSGLTVHNERSNGTPGAMTLSSSLYASDSMRARFAVGSRVVDLVG